MSEVLGSVLRPGRRDSSDYWESTPYTSPHQALQPIATSVRSNVATPFGPARQVVPEHEHVKQGTGIADRVQPRRRVQSRFWFSSGMSSGSLGGGIVFRNA